MRPAREGDNYFIESLYKANRDDLRLIDAEDDFIESLIDMQHKAQTQGYGDTFPNAMYFIVEKHNERVGRVVLDFSPNEIRIIDIALLPAAQGHGFASGIIKALQLSATKSRTPLALSVYKTNMPARQLYATLGFKLVDSNANIDFLAWQPDISDTTIFS